MFALNRLWTKVSNIVERKEIVERTCTGLQNVTDLVVNSRSISSFCNRCKQSSEWIRTSVCWYSIILDFIYILSVKLDVGGSLVEPSPTSRGPKHYLMQGAIVFPRQTRLDSSCRQEVATETRSRRLFFDCTGSWMIKVPSCSVKPWNNCRSTKA